MTTQQKIELLDTHPGISPERRKLLRELFENHTEESYVLCGPARYGKSAMMKAVFQLTPMKKNRTRSFTDAHTWQQEITDAACGHYCDPNTGCTKEADGSNEYPLISAKNLRRVGEYRVAVFIDDLDKIRWTTEKDFILVELWALLEEVIRGKHQLVISTNFSSPEEFKKHFGAAIAGRILEVCKFVRFYDVETKA